MNGFAIAAQAHRRGLVQLRQRGAAYAFRQTVDRLLGEIEEELEQRPAGRRRIPDKLWYELAVLADQVGQPDDPPQRYLQAHDYALDLQERDQARRREAAGVR